MAVSPGSHAADWRHEAYGIIGSTPTHPEGGFRSLEEMMKRAPPQTCNMIERGAEMNAVIDATKVLPDYRRGDVLLCKRWLFHRTEPVNDVGRRYLESARGARPDMTPAFKRYTVRYELGTSRLLEGFSLEPSVILRPENAGRTLDEVCSDGGSFYPRCWPFVDDGEIDGTEDLVENVLPVAEKIRTELIVGIVLPTEKQSKSTMDS